MIDKRIAISGATSFTGAWLCHKFARLGWKVHALCTQSAAEYVGLKRTRCESIQASAKVYTGLKAEDGTMVEWIKKVKPPFWIHHHHHMDHFRSKTYDVEKSKAVGLAPLPDIVEALGVSGCRGIIFSGSYFEPGEGGNKSNGRETPYSKTKLAVWEALEREASRAKIPLSKVVIPDPIGPMENEDRLLPILIKYALGHGHFQLRTPDGIADHLPVDILAEIYVDVAEKLASGKAIVVRPSGWVGKNATWIDFVGKNLFEKQLGVKSIDVKSVVPSDWQDLPKGLDYKNPEKEKVDIQWDAFWENYAHWVKTNQPWR
jgi:UDP-glucose 4-epimerase